MLFSDLELMVQADMFEQGFDPANHEDIKYYWEMVLNGN